ncbi:U-box domain-containing protein 4-like [Chenopodium quinoa]|uniref:RING-type E3 ubiquitin transferase n=1 Tax=Chenopodium quinoa TaxID=63459 RepID=A0A803KY47_CHEQI|nr:U-box domain-containing protein 4-like [Chenopodium quinoa]
MVSYTDLEQGVVGDVNQQKLHKSSEAGEINEVGMMAKDQDLPAPAATGTQQKERKRYNPKIRVQSMGLSPMIVPLSAREGQNEVAARFEAHVKELVENLKSTTIETVREATCELRILAKELDNQILIASCGAISPLVDLLCSSDMKTQENAVTAVLNLSISNNNKISIVKAEAIEPLIHVLQTGTSDARENAAATLYSLSVFEENKIRIGNSGAIDALVDLLGNGTPRGRKDAATALFYLSTCTDNRLTIVKSGAVKHLIDLMDPATGMVDRAVVVLANLASGPEGRKAIAEAGGISLLVEAIELGSPRGKENAAAALVHFCADSNRYCRRVLEEGAVPPLVILSMSGTSRAKEKANRVLQHLRNLKAAYNARAGGLYT